MSNKMKERIKNIITILLVFGGLVLCAALIDYYLPEWVYYTFLGLVLAWIVWDSSKPEKKEEKHYWMYHSILKENGKITIGVIQNDKPHFSLSGSGFDIKTSFVFGAIEIDKETFDIIDKAIKGMEGKDNE